MKLRFDLFALLLGSGLISPSSGQSVQWESSDRVCTYRGTPARSRGGAHSGDGDCVCPEIPGYEEFVWEGPMESNRTLLDPETIPKFVEHLPIPSILYDDEADPYRTEDGIPYFNMALRQFYQQILPNVHWAQYPKTKVWGFGDPDRPETFSNPSNTIETTKDKEVEVVWINDLVKDPDMCRRYGDAESCNHLPHILVDRNGIPLVDQTLHWSNPPQTCKDGSTRPDCVGDTADPYLGPISHVIHNHGAHVLPESDGYPEAWFLPPANTIPDDFARVGTFYASKEDPFTDSVLQCNPNDNSYAVYRYRNDQPTANLWFHDHTLGITSLNAYAASAGSYMIRNEGDEGETFLAEKDCNGEKQKLPGPPARFGEDPNDPEVRKNIREIPLIIRDMSFYDDGQLWFPAVSMWFYTRIIQRSPQAGVSCVSGELYGQNDGLAGDEIPYLPGEDSDIHPIANLIRTFSTIVVNGKTWPKLEVAPERYRFRIVQAADSRTFNLALKINYDAYHPERPYKELPMYVIGSDQGLQPHVGIAKSCTQKKVESCRAKEHDEEPLFGQETDKKKKKKRTHEEYEAEADIDESNYDECEFGSESLVVGPGERYDIIVDFSELKRGETVTLVNLGYDGAHQGGLGLPPLFGFFGDNFGSLGVNLKTTGLVMKFIVFDDLKKEGGDDSTHPEDLLIEDMEESCESTFNRTLGSVVPASDGKVCGVFYGGIFSNGGSNVGLGDPPGNCTWIEQDCDGSNGFFALSLLLATEGNLGSLATPRKWGEPITENPELDSCEIWEFFNPTAVAHPIHVHLVEFEVLNRQRINNTICNIEPENCAVGEVFDSKPWEKRKDMVLVDNGWMARIKMHFDLPGRYVWHCHLLSHEDNEMMLPMCVGDLEEDCPEPPRPTPPPTMVGEVNPLYLWESSKWEERSYGDQETELDLHALDMAVEEMSNANSGLGVTATVFDSEGNKIHQVTEGTKYCQGPWRITDLVSPSVVCNSSNFVDGWDPEDLVYAAYSGSKVIVAMTFLAAVVQENKGTLDQPLRKSLPQYFDVPNKKGEITPRQMLSHVSGIPWEGQVDEELVGKCFELDLSEGANSTTLEKCMETIANDVDLIADPGAQYEHSNLNMQPLSAVILALTNETLDANFQKYFAEPLGLEKTTYECPLSLSTDEFPYASLGICTTVNEYSKIVQLLTNNGVVVEGENKGKRLLSRFSMEELFRPQTGFARVNNEVSLSINQGFDFGSTRCKPGVFSAVPDNPSFNPISQIDYGLGTFRDSGVKGEMWFHESFMGPYWAIMFGKYSILLAAQFPFFWATPYWFRILDKFELASKFTVVPVGEEGSVELELCQDLWTIEPALGEELFVYDCESFGLNGSLPLCT